MKVVIYGRVSTSEQKLEPQMEELYRYCGQHGWEIVGERFDQGYTGGNDDRPGLQQVMQWAREGFMEAIVVTKLDRLFRSLRHLVNTMDELKKYNVGLKALRDPVDWTTPNGRLFVQMLAVLAEFERELIRERVTAGLEYAKKSGVVLGRPVERPDDEIMALRLQGFTYREIQKELECSMGAICRAIEAYEKEQKNPHNTTSQN